MSRENFRQALAANYNKPEFQEEPGDEMTLPPSAPPLPSVPAVPVPVAPPFPASDGIPAMGSAPPTVAGALLAQPAKLSDDPLPEFKVASGIVRDEIVLPEPIVESLLHRGCKMVLAGGSKSFKSWSLIDLGLSVAAGAPWWGLPTRAGTVLYLNFELIEGFFEQRIDRVCAERAFPLPENFLFWTLRNHCYDLEIISRVLQQRAKLSGLSIDLIIVDPIYKALGGLSENDAGDMGILMENIEKLGKEIDAAVVFGAHYSKGVQGGKEAIDRMAGSGVFARDPDVILTMTRHVEKGTFVIESTLRYMPDLENFCVTWQFPLMRVDESRDPAEMLGLSPHESKKNEREPDFDEADVFHALPVSGLQDSSWKEVIHKTYGKAGRAYYAAKESLMLAGKVRKAGNKYYPAHFKLAKEETKPQPMPPKRVPPLPAPPLASTVAKPAK